MAHFAKLGVGNIVEQVIVLSNDIATTEQAGVDFINKLYNTRDVWKQTSYNNNIRKNYAGIGYTFDGIGFAAPQPYPSWSKDSTTYLWQAPTPMPTTAGKRYQWVEADLAWEEIV